MDRLKVLVVDDESRMRKLVKDFLVKSGFEVVEAEDGEQAVDVFIADKDNLTYNTGCDDAEDEWIRCVQNDKKGL